MTYLYRDNFSLFDVIIDIVLKTSNRYRIIKIQCWTIQISTSHRRLSLLYCEHLALQIGLVDLEAWQAKTEKLWWIYHITFLPRTLDLWNGPTSTVLQNTVSKAGNMAIFPLVLQLFIGDGIHLPSSAPSTYLLPISIYMAYKTCHQPFYLTVTVVVWLRQKRNSCRHYFHSP